jgi:hypothetical protein
MSKKHRFEEDTKKETVINMPGGADDQKAADADYDDIEIVIDESEVEEETDKRSAGGTGSETD